MSRFLPVGAVNPFAEFVGGRSNVAATVIHRKPFSQDELHALFTAARQDPFMYPLIVTAACTGMRRGDVCALRWSDVGLSGGGAPGAHPGRLPAVLCGGVGSQH
jgi:integrase